VSWRLQDAERHLRSLELFGMRFGLERMRRLMTALDSPQREFEAIHVVGTNGKSSTTRMIAAILERHRVRTGAYLSPHLVSYAERIQVSEHDADADAFAAAIERAAWAAEHVNHTLAEDDHVTQFELLSAAAFWELARRGVEVAVVEAGLGGRYDATNVLGARECVLTNVGLEHTRWLGPTVRDIATEKLAVVPRGATLVLPDAVQPEVFALAQALAAREEVRLLSALKSTEVALAARGAFQRQNFALARVAAESYLAASGRTASEQAIEQAAAEVVVPGRFEVVSRSPLTILDGAHNIDAVHALSEALADTPQELPRGLVFGVLDDKDAVGMLRVLLPMCRHAWFTAPPSPRALPPATLQSLAAQLGFADSSCEPQPLKALRAASEWAVSEEAASAGAAPAGMVLVTGSVYLVGALTHELGALPAISWARKPRGMNAP
jgi:dihydrofolate synthase/folylpolyglutamate synthase